MFIGNTISFKPNKLNLKKLETDGGTEHTVALKPLFERMKEELEQVPDIDLQKVSKGIYKFNPPYSLVCRLFLE